MKQVLIMFYIIQILIKGLNFTISPGKKEYSKFLLLFKILGRHLKSKSLPSLNSDSTNPFFYILPCLAECNLFRQLKVRANSVFQMQINVTPRSFLKTILI